jgi:hypothetical protein
VPERPFIDEIESTDMPLIARCSGRPAASLDFQLVVGPDSMAAAWRICSAMADAVAGGIGSSWLGAARRAAWTSLAQVRGELVGFAAAEIDVEPPQPFRDSGQLVSLLHRVGRVRR